MKLLASIAVVSSFLAQSAFALSWDLAKVQLKPSCLENARNVKFQLEEPLSQSNALLAMLFSYYDGRWDQEAITAQLKKLGFKKVSFHDQVRGVHGFTAHSRSLVYVHFEGTHDVPSVIADAHFGLASAAELGLRGAAHLGFLSTYLRARASVLSSLEETGDKPILFSGHSYGGSLAALAAADAVLQGRNLFALFTSGQPRLGNPDLIAHLDELLGQRYFRTTFGNDMVPHVPPTAAAAHAFAGAFSYLGPVARHAESLALRFEYSQIVPAWHVGEGSGRTVEDDAGEDQAYWSRLDGLPGWNAPAVAAAFADHDTGRYSCAAAQAMGILEPR